MAAGKQPVEQGGTHPTDVQITSRARGKTGTNHVHSMRDQENTHADHAVKKASGPVWAALYRKATVTTRQVNIMGSPQHE
jgi:hypothetical protein